MKGEIKMGRNIIRVTATQVVTSENNPQGLFSTMQGYPVDFDSDKAPYNGDIERCMKAAKAEYYDRLGKNYGDTNPNRVMTTVTLEMANGEQILAESIGGFPEIVPPEPEPEPEDEPEPEEPEDEPEPEPEG